MIFQKIKPGKIRVLLDAGGRTMVNGIEKKNPCRWADFRDKDTVQINNPKDIALMKKASGYGKEFVVLPKKKDIEENIKHPLEKETTLVED